MERLRALDVSGKLSDIRKPTQEQLRRRYRPRTVRLLFIGESPPASGRFFYAADSGLYRAMRQAFQAVDPAVDGVEFLKVFQTYGCYLVDLCPEPVDRMAPTLRRAACHAGEAALAKNIAQMRPEVIVTLLRSIEKNCACAMQRASWHGKAIHLPYPGRWERLRKEFVENLSPVIRSLGRRSEA